MKAQGCLGVDGTYSVIEDDRSAQQKADAVEAEWDVGLAWG